MPGWMQANVPLGAHGRVWLELIGGDFQETIAAWLSQDVDRRRFFFTFKRPGLRLRFLGVDREQRARLAALLDRHCGQGTGWSEAPYDPELQQFGGPVGLDLAHRYFTLDSLAVLGAARLRLYGGARLSPEELSLVMLHRVLAGATGDRWELWDLWCRMELTDRLEHPVGSRAWRAAAPSAPDRMRVLALLYGTGADPSEGEQRVLAAYATPLGSLVSDVHAAVDAGELTWPLRDILPFWVVTHWNRMAFPAPVQRRLTMLMTHVLCPKS